MKKEALIIVDAQKDFGEKGGSLYVNEGENIIPAINKLIDEVKAKTGIVIASRDWHPDHHVSFSIWPKHCVENTYGAEYMDGLNVNDIDYEVKKGFRVEEDSYSAFGGYEFRGEFPLRKFQDLLVDCEVRILKIVGLATDYCVKSTVLDALEAGFEVEVMNAGIRAVNINPIDETRAVEEMKTAGARFL